MLWRASISRKRDFSTIDFGEKYNEEIRSMIIQKEPKQDDKFPISIWCCDGAMEGDSEIIVPFRRLKCINNTGNFYWLTFGLLSFIIIISPNCSILQSEMISDLRIRFDGRVYLLHVPRKQYINLVKKSTGLNYVQKK